MISVKHNIFLFYYIFVIVYDTKTSKIVWINVSSFKNDKIATFLFSKYSLSAHHRDIAEKMSRRTLNTEHGERDILRPSTESRAVHGVTSVWIKRVIWCQTQLRLKRNILPSLHMRISWAPKFHRFGLICSQRGSHMCMFFRLSRCEKMKSELSSTLLVDMLC